MHNKRLILLIVIITLLGLITAWQQIQTVRLGYRVSDLAVIKQKLTTQNHTLQTDLTAVKSPNRLRMTADTCQMKLIYSGEANLTEVKEHLDKTGAQNYLTPAQLGRNMARFK